MADINILVTCTDRKRAPIAAQLRLRSVQVKGTARRAKVWWRRLETHAGETRTAESTYAGQHWTVARSLPAAAKQSGLSARLWVISAGYGLIPASAPIRAYSATFSSGHPDSVGDASSAWWNSLAEYDGPVRGTPRTVRDLVSEDRRSSTLVVASPPYLAAMRDDLEAAVGLLGPKQRFVVVSSMRAAGLTGLAAHFVQIDARLQPVVGGSRGSIAVRIGRKILENAERWGMSARSINEKVRSLAARARSVERPARTRLQDTQVRKLVRDALEAPDPLSCSALLRRMRDEGYACEQHRFKALYAEVVNGS